MLRQGKTGKESHTPDPAAAKADRDASARLLRLAKEQAADVTRRLEYLDTLRQATGCDLLASANQLSTHEADVDATRGSTRLVPARLWQHHICLDSYCSFSSSQELSPAKHAGTTHRRSNASSGRPSSSWWRSTLA